jgi:hypothetical protein
MVNVQFPSRPSQAKGGKSCAAAAWTPQAKTRADRNFISMVYERNERIAMPTGKEIRPRKKLGPP